MTSSKPLPILDHMPLEIKEKIVGYADTLSKFRLRQCSKCFKQIVDASEIVYDKLQFTWTYVDKVASVTIEPIAHYVKRKSFQTSSVMDYSHINSALQFLEMLLKIHSRIRINQLIIRLDYARINSIVYENEPEYLECKKQIRHHLKQILTQFEEQLAVSELSTNSDRDAEDVLAVLPYLKPGTLWSIKIWNSNAVSCTEINGTGIDLSKIAETEQWKQARYLDLGMFTNSLPREKTAHFLTMTYRVRLLELEEVKYTVENFLRENGWSYRRIRFDAFNFHGIPEYLSQFEIVDREHEMDAHRFKMTIGHGGYKCIISQNGHLNCMIFNAL